VKENAGGYFSFLKRVNEEGVHIVTVNDYLANRDQVSMGQIYRFLGLDTGLIQDGMSHLNEEKIIKRISYVTNTSNF
jgi:preprotein translocase subunit SecA